MLLKCATQVVALLKVFLDQFSNTMGSNLTIIGISSLWFNSKPFYLLSWLHTDVKRTSKRRLGINFKIFHLITKRLRCYHFFACLVKQPRHWLPRNLATNKNVSYTQRTKTCKGRFHFSPFFIKIG